jgi:hypothetical protein
LFDRYLGRPGPLEHPINVIGNLGGRFVSTVAIRHEQAAGVDGFVPQVRPQQHRLWDREAERARNIDTVCYQCPPRDRIL